jgi:hypothetical protein
MKSLLKCLAFGAGAFIACLIIGETLHWSIRDR